MPVSPTCFHVLEQTVISSDTASGTNNPVLVLRLTLSGAGGNTFPLIVELTRSDLDAVLRKFEAIAAVRAPRASMLRGETVSPSYWVAWLAANVEADGVVSCAHRRVVSVRAKEKL